MLRSALRLMEERERQLVAIDTAIGRGIADINANRVHDAECMFDELDNRYGTEAPKRAKA